MTEAVTDFKNLTKIDLSNNQLDRICNQYFSGLVYLKNINN